MKSDLYLPFTEERKIILQKGIFYLPDYFEEFTSFAFPAWSELFGNELPVVFEFCSGNGTWINERAEQFPKKNWVAIEKRFDRVQKIWARKERSQRENLFIVSGEGHAFSTHFVPSLSVAEIYINFPDPWPKRRHAKHRIMKAPFLREMARILEVKGKVHFITDDKEYLESTLVLFKENKDFRLDALVTNPSDYGRSYFDELWREKGRTIYYAQYCRE